MRDVATTISCREKKKEPEKIRKLNPLLSRVRDLAKGDMEKDVLPTFLL